MAVWRLIPVGDLLLSDPDPVTGKRAPVMLTGAEYVRQTISTRLKFFQGEWFNDMREGVPYYVDLFIPNPDPNRLSSMFRKILLSVQEVASVKRLTVKLDLRSRVAALEFDVQLVAGGVLKVRQPDPPFIVTLPRSAS
jgi:hypothetical protein